MNNFTMDAAIDRLTGFLNKEYVNNELIRLCKKETGALLILNMDSFKQVNDIYGRDMGDKLLIAFADVIRKNTRSEDTVGRLGSDEFIVFCSGSLSEKALAGIVRRINEQLVAAAKELMGENMNIPIGVSVGAVFVPEHGRDYQELFTMADKALYFVKQNEKHGYAIYTQKNTDMPVSNETSAEALHRMSLIFEERNVSDAAFWLGQESFSQVYRFMMRYIQSYRGVAYKALFRVTPKSNDLNGAEFAALIERFGTILNRSLRKSDIMMQCGADQFFLLLPEITDKYIEKVLDRVIAQWKETDYAQKAEVDYSVEGVCAGEMEETERRGK